MNSKGVRQQEREKQAEKNDIMFLLSCEKIVKETVPEETRLRSKLLADHIELSEIKTNTKIKNT